MLYKRVPYIYTKNTYICNAPQIFSVLCEKHTGGGWVYTFHLMIMCHIYREMSMCAVSPSDSITPCDRTPALAPLSVQRPLSASGFMGYTYGETPRNGRAVLVVKAIDSARPRPRGQRWSGSKKGTTTATMRSRGASKLRRHCSRALKQRAISSRGRTLLRDPRRPLRAWTSRAGRRISTLREKEGRGRDTVGEHREDRPVAARGGRATNIFKA